MEQLGIRQDQHSVIDNDNYTLPPALYFLDKDEKKSLCQFLQRAKMPDGFSSNIRRCVDANACKVSRLKTHDYHIILQKLLPLIVRKILLEDVVMPLIQLSRFFTALCSKELVGEDLDKLSSSIKETLCRLEMVFPPVFFDIMIHLPVHLAEEAKLGGPMCYRWMYPVERYLRTVKGYVRNKTHPEDSIAEGYIVEECLTFCSRFLDVDTKLNRADRHESTAMNEPPSGLSIFGEMDYKRRGQTIEIFGRDEDRNMRHYIISNYDEARPWVNEHMEELKKIV
ncbi:uncharacterized protein C2845_PM03G29660 [Panicum miliaceum]|uniref:DUF4218 domain-containing protein n=1 Tax=Panicum miliaceum TaxID=4540 RepID=A0A3L6TD83_PANMI|nr:uncharacterized protein C2845_PM03G29660 [Panicum miliaceum]